VESEFWGDGFIISEERGVKGEEGGVKGEERGVKGEG
jgi:hypothetical protein